MIFLVFLVLSVVTTATTVLDSSNSTDSRIIEALNSTNFTEFFNDTEWTTTTSSNNSNFSILPRNSTLNLSPFTECQYTSGLESRFSEFLISHPSYVDCDFTKHHSCYSLVSEFDNSLIQLGCEKSSICGESAKDHCFQHSSGYMCCCQTNNCNNYSNLHLKLKDNGFKDDYNILYEWWHFPIFVLSTFTLLCLFATILAVLFVIKNIINLSNDEEKHDKKLLSRIHIHHLKLVRENQKTARANAEIAVQEFYQFLESQRLVKSKKARSKAKFRHDYVVMNLTLRSIRSLQKVVSKNSDFKLYNSNNIIFLPQIKIGINSFLHR
uniref:Uncharacterized protein n=1 Tax=Panagrolaimus sp. ES5 TaxID=591445 RepID=A0AC34FTB0_9BILA